MLNGDLRAPYRETRRPLFAAALPAAVVLAAATALTTSPAAAQSDWNWRFDPYLWGTSISGDLALGSELHEADVSFSDILNVLAGTALLHVEATRGRIGFFGDLVWLAVEAETEVRRTGAASGADFETLILELGYLRALEDSPFALELGLRYWDFELGLDSRPAYKGQNDWVDGFVGGRRTSSIGSKWTSTARLNLGAGGSDLTYGLQLEYALALANDNALLVGYKILAIDRDDASADGSSFIVDQTIQGLTIGYRFD